MIGEKFLEILILILMFDITTSKCIQKQTYYKGDLNTQLLNGYYIKSYF